MAATGGGITMGDVPGRARRRVPGRREREKGRTGVSTVHLVVGSLIIVIYIAVLVGYFRGMQGAPAAWVRQLSMAGALLLLVQYALGFTLLGNSDVFLSTISAHTSSNLRLRSLNQRKLI